MNNPQLTPHSMKNSFSPMVGNKARMPTFTTLIQHNTESPRQSNYTRKKYPHWKGGVKLSLFIDDMILYVGNPKDSTPKQKLRAQEICRIYNTKISCIFIY